MIIITSMCRGGGRKSMLFISTMCRGACGRGVHVETASWRCEGEIARLMTSRDCSQMC